MTTDLNPPRILGLCASLRAGRWADGSAELVQQIRALDSDDALRAFLKEQSLAHFENFVNAGRSDGSMLISTFCPVSARRCVASPIRSTMRTRSA